MYHIPDLSKEGVIKSRAQYNRVLGEEYSAKYYRDLLLKEVTKEIRKVKEEGVKGIIVAGNFNQNIANQKLQEFMVENSLYEIHREVNDFKSSARDKTYNKGSNQIDAVLASEEVLNQVRGSRLVDFNEVVISDYRGFLIDIDFEQYFEITVSVYDRSETRKLNPTNRKH
jgi:hypothetical protein